MKTKKVEPRKDYITWDEYFMGVAALSAMRSKDPSTINGAVVVDPETKRIISCGYNGFPKNKHIADNDKIFPWDRKGKINKYQFVIHAEVNAILNSPASVRGAVMYSYSEKGYPPCQECMKIIVQSGIKEIVLASLIKGNTDSYNWEPTKMMSKLCKVNIKVLSNNKNILKKIIQNLNKLII